MSVIVPVISTFDSRGITQAIRDFKKLDGAGQKTQFALMNTDKAVTSLGKTLFKFGAITAGVAGIIGKQLATDAYESQKVMRQTEAIIKATGTSAGMTAKQIQNLSQELSNKTGIDDEAIQSSLNLLLTFKQVRNEAGAGNDIFNRASMAILDLGNVFGSTDAAAKQLGKALADPNKGITALRRSGINFSDAQKELIKTLVASGNVLEAQKVILTEVESQVGGTAAASATAFDRMRVAIGNASEDLGTVLIPYIERFATFVQDKIIPIVSKFADIVGREGLGTGVAYLSDEFLTMTANMGALGNTILAVTAAFTALKLVTIAATIAQTAFNVALFANPIGIAVAAVIALGVAIVALMVKFKPVRELFINVWNSIVDSSQRSLNAVLGVFEFFINQLTVGVNLIIRAWNSIPFAPKAKELAPVNLALDITGMKIDGLKKKTGQWGQTLEGIKDLKGVGEFGATDELKNLPPAFTAMGNSVSSAGKAVETASQKFEKFKEQAKSVANATRSVRDASKSTADAQKELQKTTDAVAVAQAKLNKIATGYGPNSLEGTEAQKALTKANREAVQAQLDLEKANFAVSDAETALQQARATGNARDIREAEIALQEAVMSQTEAQETLTEATDAVTLAQTKLNETINGASIASQTYKDALVELQSAQDAQTQAIDRVRDAKERELDSTRNLVKAEILLRKARGKLTRRQRAVADQILADLNMPVNVSIPAVSNVVPLARGGIVTRPTLSLIGEGGEPEAVIPLSKMNETVGGGNTYIININSKIADESLPDLLVAELRKFNRRSGAINIQVA